MPKNEIGFILKRHRQPDYYRIAFEQARAYYKAENGREFVVVACTNNRYGGGLNRDIKFYWVCEQRELIYSIHENVTSQKKAMEYIEELLESNKQP